MALDQILRPIVRELTKLGKRVTALEARRRHIPVCLVSASAAVSIGSGSWANVTFNTDDLDPDDLHSTVSNTDRITVVVPGVYAIMGNGDFAASGAGTQRGLAISVGGSNVSQQIGNVLHDEISVATLYELAASDIVRLAAFQDSGGALNLSNARLSVALVG